MQCKQPQAQSIPGANPTSAKQPPLCLRQVTQSGYFHIYEAKDDKVGPGVDPSGEIHCNTLRAQTRVHLQGCSRDWGGVSPEGYTDASFSPRLYSLRVDVQADILPSPPTAPSACLKHHPQRFFSELSAANTA